MELLRPELGTIFWMLLSFLTILFVLGKYAWKPILRMLKDRETSIADALSAADRAREEMAKLQADNDRVLAEARRERDQMLKEAREVKDKIIAEAKEQAQIEAAKMVENAKLAIENEKAAALSEIKVKVTNLSVSIAEKILAKELSDKSKYEDFVNQSLKDLKLN